MVRDSWIILIILRNSINKPLQSIFFLFSPLFKLFISSGFMRSFLSITKPMDLMSVYKKVLFLWMVFCDHSDGMKSVMYRVVVGDTGEALLLYSHLWWPASSSTFSMSRNHQKPQAWLLWFQNCNEVLWQLTELSILNDVRETKQSSIRTCQHSSTSDPVYRWHPVRRSMFNSRSWVQSPL